MIDLKYHCYFCVIAIFLSYKKQATVEFVEAALFFRYLLYVNTLNQNIISTVPEITSKTDKVLRKSIFSPKNSPKSVEKNTPQPVIIG